MFSFKKKTPIALKKEDAPSEQAASAPSVDLASARIAPIFHKMYLWVLSVNLNFNAYQVESGIPELAGQTFPLRGQYKTLLTCLSGGILPEYQERFSGTFEMDALIKAFRSGRTSISDIFCLTEEVDHTPVCVELRVERVPDSNPDSFVLLIYARRLQSEDDHGSIFHENTPTEMLSSDDIDWKAVRLRRYSHNISDLQYEYSIADDRFILHYGAGMGDTKVWERHLFSLESRSDYIISHDSIPALRALLKNGIAGQSGEAEVVLRGDGKRGSPYRHYRMTCLPLEESGTPTWLFGSLSDIEESHKRQAGLEEIAQQIGTVVEKVFTNLYLINTDKNTIRALVKGENGFRLSDTSCPFSTYFEQRIREGIISEESAQSYRSLTKKGYLEQRVGSNPMTLHVQLKLPGTLEYRWYEELICSVPGSVHTFMLSRRDISVLYAEKQKEFEMAESLRMAKHNETMLDAVAGLVEFRNVETGSHIRMVRVLTKVFLEDIARRSPQYGITPRMIRLCAQAATMHDIGKITVPDAILNSPLGLTPEEFAVMKTHTTSGAQIIRQLDLPGQEDLKELCVDVAQHHHERWDGSGYPDGIAGEEISIYSQAVGLADVMDALVSERCYKRPYPFDTALEMIRTGKCGQFNPRVLETMTQCADTVRAIYQTEHIDNTKDEHQHVQ